MASEWILNWKDLSSALVAQDRRWPWVGDGMILSAGTKWNYPPAKCFRIIEWSFLHLTSWESTCRRCESLLKNCRPSCASFWPFLTADIAAWIDYGESQCEWSKQHSLSTFQLFSFSEMDDVIILVSSRCQIPIISSNSFAHRSCCWFIKHICFLIESNSLWITAVQGISEFSAWGRVKELAEGQKRNPTRVLRRLLQ